jgi:hypothetical protein
MESAKPALLLFAGTREPLTQGRPLLLGTSTERLARHTGDASFAMAEQ